MNTEPPARRIILLGASNLANAYPMLMHWFHQHWSGPREILAAFGHGRSYGQWSRLLFVRALPGILESELFPWLDEHPAPDARICALLTDIGNDLLYDSPVEQIVAWVEDCVNRLQAMRAEILITLPPLERVRELKPWQYYPIRTLMFPGRRLQYADLMRRIDQLTGELRQLAAGHTISALEPRREWYGLDPIHILRQHRAVAWREILSHWSDCTPEPPAPVSFRQSRQMNRLPFACRRIFGQLQERPQPALQWEQSSFFLF